MGSLHCCCMLQGRVLRPSMIWLLPAFSPTATDLDAYTAWPPSPLSPSSLPSPSPRDLMVPFTWPSRPGLLNLMYLPSSCQSNLPHAGGATPQAQTHCVIVLLHPPHVAGWQGGTLPVQELHLHRGWEWGGVSCTFPSSPIWVDDKPYSFKKQLGGSHSETSPSHLVGPRPPALLLGY